MNDALYIALTECLCAILLPKLETLPIIKILIKWIFFYTIIKPPVYIYISINTIQFFTMSCGVCNYSLVGLCNKQIKNVNKLNTLSYCNYINSHYNHNRKTFWLHELKFNCSINFIIRLHYESAWKRSVIGYQFRNTVRALPALKQIN